MIEYITDDGCLDQMTAIERACFPTPWSREDIKSAIDAGGIMRLMGEFEDGRLLSWCCASLSTGEAHLMTLAVSPEERGKGRGRRLLRAIMQASADAGARVMVLECRSRNTAARALYKSEGFFRLGLRKGYYEDTGDDAIIFIHPCLPEGNAENDPYLIRE